MKTFNVLGPSPARTLAEKFTMGKSPHPQKTTLPRPTPPRNSVGDGGLGCIERIQPDFTGFFRFPTEKLT